MNLIRQINDELKDTYDKLEKAYMESIETLRYTVEAKDSYTRGHSDRVSAYSVLIGEKLGLSDNDINTLKIGGLFHDIGKPLSYYVGEDNLGHFHGHWVKSQEIFHKFAKKNNMDDKSRDLIEKLIFYHDLNVRKLNEEDFNKFIKEFNKDEIIMLFNLKKSDLLAHSPKYHYILEEYENTLDELLNNYF